MHRRVLVPFAVLAAACAAHVPESRRCDPAGAGRPLCGLRNPEDVVALPGTPWLLASELRRSGDPPGSIVAFTLDGAEATTVVGPSHPAERLVDPFLARNAEICPGPLPPDGFEPHGMDLVVEGAPPWMLLVVNHGTRESIEVYDVTPDTGPPRLRWVGCVPLPDGLAANDVASLPDGQLVASASPASGVAYLLSFVRLGLGLPLGDAIAWSFDGGWTHVDGTSAGLPNGIAAAADGRLWVADWAGSRLIRVDRTTGRRDEVALPHHPDNISWTADGRLLVAGQVGSIRIALGCLDGAVRNCGQPWSIVSIDPDTLVVTPVTSGDGGDFGAASSALRIGDAMVVGTWAGDRVLRLPAAGATAR